ncbi:MAG: HD domain-containing protein [Candidatus Aenigmarchaeota archaeon]|nr:HD domain-containing protein [Candidatus Aenigmarchaeota archaeon]
MVEINEKLYFEKISKDSLIGYLHEIIESNEKISALLEQANTVATERFFYNDHGKIHSRIVSAASLEIFEILLKFNIIPSIVENNIGLIEDSKVVIFLSAYLHDIGNAFHRENHPLIGSLLAFNLLDEILLEIYPDIKKRNKIKAEISHSIYSHDEKILAASIESSIIKVADGLDMAEGRARIPYKLGKADIHAFSALSIKKVELESTKEKPILIRVHMNNEAGIFQIEKVLIPKIQTTIIKKYTKIEAIKNGEILRIYEFD